MVYMDNAATTKMTPAVIQAICCPYPRPKKDWGVVCP